MPSVQSLLNRFNTIKTLPHISIRLSKMISDNTSNMEEFEAVIRLDPTLVVRLLRLVNSSYYALREKVSSISEALVFVGMDSLRNMVVLEALKSIFNLDSQNNHFSKRLLWMHCSAVSMCSQMIAQRIFSKNGENAFLCGILHDVGIIVEHQVEPDLFFDVCNRFKQSKGNITDLERRIIGCDHSEIGALLAREWNLPRDVQAGINEHHKVMNNVVPSSISGIIQLAEYLVSRLEYTALAGMSPTLSPPLANHIRENIGEYRTLAKDLPAELEKAKELYDLDME